MKKFWQLLKAGIVPLFIASIPVYLSYLIYTLVASYGLRIVGNAYYDVPITIAIAVLASCVFGYVVSLQWFQNFARNYLLAIPILGWLIVIFVLPKRKLNLVEVRTTWGPTAEESGWEFALETCDPWIEDGQTWHRAHTLSWGGKLFSRIGENNIRVIAVPPHKAWMTILSLGLLK